MSLQVWMPLNGDLHNQGLSNLIFTNVNSNYTTIDNNGKIGKCYTNNSHTEGGLVSNTTINLGQKQSMFCWFKFTDLVSTSSLGGNLVSQHRYSSNQGLGISIKYVSSTTGYLSVNTGDGSNRTYNTYCGTTLLQANTWYHGGFTYDNGTMKIYVNGICEKTVDIGTQSVPADYLVVFAWSLNSTSGSGVFGNYKLQGSLNDVRVYNHCLSEGEIKRLARGLVVHYPLNNNGLGNENLYGYGSDCTSVASLNQSTNKFTVVTEDGHVCAHASGALQTTAYLQSQIPFTPKPLEYITFSAYVKIKNIVRGTTNPMCEFYFSGQTIDGAWRSVNYIKWTKDGVEVPHTAIGFDNTGSFNMNDGKWHYVTATVQFLNYNYTSDCRPSIYLRDCTGDMYVHHIKYERGQVATPWCESSYANLVFATPNDHTIYVEPDGSRWLRIFHHNNPVSTLFASTDDFANGFYKDTNRWYRIENICGMVSQWEFMVKQKPTSDGTESKYRWVQTKNPIVATHDDVSPSAVTRITTSGYTDGTYGGLYKSATGRTRLTIANGVANNWWGAMGAWTDYSGGIPGYPQIKVTTGYIDLYIRIDNLSFNETEYDISGFGNNGIRTGIFTWSSDTPKYNVSTIFQNNSSITTSAILGSTNRYQQLTFAAWIKRTSNDTTDRFYWKSTAFTTGISTYDSISNYFDIRWNHATTDSASQHRWINNIMPQNTWVYVTWVFNSGVWSFYKDGVLVSTRNDSSTGTYIYGDISQSSNNNWIGNVSDVRIYATALSADDIKSLYQNCATIGPDGIIYGQIRN